MALCREKDRTCAVHKADHECEGLSGPIGRGALRSDSERLGEGEAPELTAWLLQEARRKKNLFS